MNGDIKKLLIIPRIKIQNANALSSPFTIGFPAMTAWLGAVHALERKMQIDYGNIVFTATGVVSHSCDLQTYKGVGDYVYSIVGTGNPLDKNGSRSAFIEEARCHLDVSLLIEYTGISKNDEESFLKLVSQHLHTSMKIAGGDILSFATPELLRVDEGNDKDIRKLIRKIMPGYAIVERRELMIEAMEQGMDAIDALLDYLVIHHSCEKDEEGEVTWFSKRKTSGWIVPIATGFQGVSEIGSAKNQRDPETPHRFAESIVTLGEFKMPNKIKNLNEILWRYQTDTQKNLYLCQQKIV